MAKKKKYKGIVIDEFKVGFPTGTVAFKRGDQFETTTKSSYDHLINIKKIK